MKTVITIEAYDLAGLLDLVEERRDSYARIIANYVSDGEKPSQSFVTHYEAFCRIQSALIKSEVVD